MRDVPHQKKKTPQNKTKHMHHQQLFKVVNLIGQEKRHSENTNV